MTKSLVVLASLAVMSFAAPAYADITNTFDAGTEGWTIADADGPPTLPSVGSPTFNAGGYISTADIASTVVFAAPAAYLGDKTGFYGGTISFDLSDTSNDGAAYPAVLLYGGGLVIGHDSAPPGTSFTHYDIGFTEVGWSHYVGGGYGGGSAITASEFLTVIGALTGFAIDADWQTGSDDTHLDNVRLAGGDSGSTVPEPGVWALMLVGAGLAGSSLRQRRRAAAG